MKISLSFLMFLCIFLFNSCDQDARDLRFSIIEDIYTHEISRGVVINNTKEGYWITISENNVISMECFYKNGVLHGPVKMYFDSGELMEKSTMWKGKFSGYGIKFYTNGNIRSHGRYLDNKKVGVWKFYSPYAKLDRVIKFVNDSAIILIDNKLSMPTP